MANPLFPAKFDDTYHGYKLALWLLGLILLMKAAIGLGVIFNGHEAASRADGIPIDSFAPSAAQTVLAIFAIWGLSQVILALLGAVALVRYRAMVPFVYSLVLLEHVGRKLILYFLPVAKTGRPPGFAINLALFAVEIAGLLLALWPRRSARPPG